MFTPQEVREQSESFEKAVFGGYSVSAVDDFIAPLAEDYAAVLSGERDVLFKMKELWSWQGQLFEGSEKYLKKIRKAQKLTEYKSAVAALFADCPIKDA